MKRLDSWATECSEPVREGDTSHLPVDAPAERSSADWRRLTGIWRYGSAVLPPACADFYAWLGALDAAIDERTNRATGTQS